MKTHLGKAFGSLAALTLLSRLSGFVRVAVFAAFFGGGSEADIFLAAMIIPELMYRFVSEGLVAGAAVPMFVKNREDQALNQRTFWSVFWGMSGLALIALALLWVPASIYCRLLVPGFLPEAQARMAEVWRSMTPYVLFSLQAAVMTAFLQASGHFAKPAIGPVLVNAVIIAGFFLVPAERLETLGLMVSLGGLVQSLWLLWLMKQEGMGITMPWKRSGLDWKIFAEFLGRSAPIAGWVVVTPVVPMLERYLLSFQPEGAVSVLNYTDKIVYLPLGIVSLSLASVVFPRLSEQKPEDAARTLAGVVEVLLIALFPVVLVMHVGAAQTAEVVFARGRFGPREILLTADLLSAYALFLVPASVSLLMNRLLYSCGWYKTTLFIGLAAITAQVGGDTLLVPLIGSAGIGWGATGSSFLQVAMLLIAASRIFSRDRLVGLLVPFLVVILGIVAGIPLLHELGLWLRPHLPGGRIGSLFYLFALWAIVQVPLGVVWAFMRRVWLMNGLSTADLGVSA